MKVRRGAKKIRLQGKRQNQSKFIKPKAGMHSVVQPLWQGKQSVRNNLARLGVSDDPNRAVSKMSSAASTTTPATTTDTEALFSLPPVEQRDRNPRRRLMSEEDQSYIVKLLAEYGEDFKAMERDMSLNCWQHLQTKLKSMAKLYFSLSPEQRLVPLPASSS